MCSTRRYNIYAGAAAVVACMLWFFVAIGDATNELAIYIYIEVMQHIYICTHVSYACCTYAVISW